MEQLLESQRELHGRIARTWENVKKHGLDKVSVDLIRATLPLLENKWSKFESQHYKLMREFRSELSTSDYVVGDLYSTVEACYAQQRAHLAQVERQFPPTAAQGEAKQGEARAEQVTQRSSLLRIELPKFSGKFEEWPSFRDLFVALVYNEATTNKVEKLHYLKSCVTGDAEGLLRNLPTTGENFERAWSILTEHFENKRLLVRSYLASFTALPRMRPDSANDLRRIFHGVLSTVGAMEGIGRPIARGEDLFVHLVVELLDHKTRREWESTLSKSSEPPSYEDLREFLQEQLRTQDALKEIPPCSSNKPAARAVRNAQAAIVHPGSAANNRLCPACKGPHYLGSCERFLQKSAKERRQLATSLGRCFNCLGRHQASECGSEKVCSRCQGKHHSLLHDAYVSTARQEQGAGQASAVNVATSVPKGCASVLLATVRVFVKDSSGKLHPVRALLDSGSETTLVAESLAQCLRLQRTPTSVAIYGVGGQNSGTARGRVSLNVNARNRQYAITVSSLVLPRLSMYSGTVTNSPASWPHLTGLYLADPEFSSKDPVELLLGADVYAVIAMAGLRRGEPSEPIAQQTRLGWVLMGAVGTVECASDVTTLHCVTDADLSSALRRFWEWEEPPAVAVPLSTAEQQCEDIFVSSHVRLPDGRYQVRLPLREPLELRDLSATRRNAARMLDAMERRFLRDDAFRMQYTAFMHEYEALGHMSRAAPAHAGEQRIVCYLPHHGVTKGTGANCKIRVVFNGSSQTISGHSLNESVLTGHNLLPPLSDIIMRWRSHRYVIVADIEKMYRQILVDPGDRDRQRILWKAAGETVEFRLNTVTYGVACAPYLAIRVLRQLAEDEGSRFPSGVPALVRDTYVDDVLTGASSVSACEILRDELRGLCDAGRFPLRKWASNHETLLDPIPPEHRILPHADSVLPTEEHSVLGVRWDPGADAIFMAVRLSPAVHPTRRNVLSKIARLFDPMGWLGPVIVRAKLILQSTWLQQLGWDDLLAAKEAQSWAQLEEELPVLETLRLPRWCHLDAPGATVEIHGFSDASERAYAAVVYLCVKLDGVIHISLVMGKTKVAPLKQVSLPRLELCAAALLSKVSTHVRDVLELRSAPTTLWTDSTVALSWIRGHPARWTTFVANRVSEIQRGSGDVTWRHLPGAVNPADCASRGLAPKELRDHSLWWQGPPFLKLDSTAWPTNLQANEHADLPDQRPTKCLMSRAEQEPGELTRFSSLKRLLRVTAWIFRWRTRRESTNHSPAPSSNSALTADELAAALTTWVRVTQRAAFPDEMQDVGARRPVSVRSQLRTLSPFLSDQGVLRVGGRLKHALLPGEQRHPIILPTDSHLSRLVVDAAHRRTLHGGVQATLAEVRRRFWILRGRQMVKANIHRCPPCIRWRAATPQPLMGDLPASRVTPSRPFLHAGVDFAGPVLLRTSKGRGHKASKGFLSVFVCFSTKAVHLEVVSDYSAAAFLAAFRRFIARRGLCAAVYSDCGTNFVGANSELKALFNAAGAEGRKIADQMAGDGVKWHFNPAAAPHFGGLWEAAVKSVKHHLRRVVGDTRLTFEEMTTFLAEVEACLNSRPLQALSDDPDDLTALTPGHFLIGGPLLAVPEPSLLTAPTNRLSRWQLLVQMRDHLWQRWSMEYPQSLAPRPKWWTTRGSVAEGQLCLVKGENTSPTRWPLARITQLHRGQDGEIRVVELRTATGFLTRPVVKIVPLPENIVNA